MKINKEMKRKTEKEQTRQKKRKKTPKETELRVNSRSLVLQVTNLYG